MASVGLQKLKAGDFNDRYDENQPDGTRIITLTKRGENKIYRFRVRDLYGEYEAVLSEEVIPIVVPEWIRDRMKEKKEK